MRPAGTPHPIAGTGQEPAMRADELRAYNNLDDRGRQAYDSLKGWRRPGLLLLAIGRTMRKGGHISAHMAAAKAAITTGSAKRG